MLKAELWHNKTETKNVKVAKMVEFIKTCDQYPRRFNFGNFFNSIILPTPISSHPPTQPLSAGEKKRSAENAVREEWVISFCLGLMIKTWDRVLLGGMNKNEQIQFFD